VAKDAAKRAQELGYEEVVARLEEVVKRLEAGNLPLEESLKAFEEGIALVRAGEARLGEAEKRVEQLLATAAGDRAVPFAPAETGRAEAPQTPRGRGPNVAGNDSEPPF
jgi:exodeoxyribonuclease VII small subunit